METKWNPHSDLIVSSYTLEIKLKSNPIYCDQIVSQHTYEIMHWRSCFIHQIKSPQMMWHYQKSCIEALHWKWPHYYHIPFLKKGRMHIYLLTCMHDKPIKNKRTRRIPLIRQHVTQQLAPFLISVFQSNIGIYPNQFTRSVATYPRARINQRQRNHLLLRKWFSDPEFFLVHKLKFHSSSLTHPG